MTAVAYPTVQLKRSAPDSMEPMAKKAKPTIQELGPLHKSLAWVNYVLRHANYHGWEEFTVTVNGTDMVTSASVRDKMDNYVFPNGEPMNLRYAMSLSRHYWSSREQKGERKDLWDDFNTQYK